MGSRAAQDVPDRDALPSHPVSDLTENSRFQYYREFFHELRQLGYIEGKNLVVERFSGEGRVDRYPEVARKAAARNPDVIFVITNGMADVLKEATSTIPIVALTAEPVQGGLVTSLARPNVSFIRSTRRRAAEMLLGLSARAFSLSAD